MAIFPKRRPSEKISRQKRLSHALKNGDFSGGWGGFHPKKRGCQSGIIKSHFVQGDEQKQVFCQENISAMNFLHVDQIFLWSGFETAYTITASFNELLGEPKVAKDRRVHLQRTQVGRNARVIVLPTQTTHSYKRTPLKIAINFTPLKMGPIYS